MSDKRKVQREAREEKQRRAGDKVVVWIFVVLVILAIAYMAVTFSMA